MRSGSVGWRRGAMDQMKLDSLKASIRRSEYVVDPEAVAEAIVRRVFAARAQARAQGNGPARGPDGAAAGSGDVLEAG